MYSYIVKQPFHKDGVLLQRGDALTDEDARWLELPENRHLMDERCTRIHAHHIDVPSVNVEASQGAAAPQSPKEASPPSVGMTRAFPPVSQASESVQPAKVEG